MGDDLRNTDENYGIFKPRNTRITRNGKRSDSDFGFFSVCSVLREAVAMRRELEPGFGVQNLARAQHVECVPTDEQRPGASQADARAAPGKLVSIGPTSLEMALSQLDEVIVKRAQPRFVGRLQKIGRL